VRIPKKIVTSIINFSVSK